MNTAFAYIVATVQPDYFQEQPCHVPCERDGRLYFGPCKEEMRPRVKPGDYIFGISPSGTHPRRIVFIMPVAEKITFAEAYRRYPKLRGRDCPIHVCPKDGGGYEHIPGAMHPDKWKRDISPKERDAFLVGDPAHDWIGCWLGPEGPKLNTVIVRLLRRMAVYDARGRLRRKQNDQATACTPISHEGLFRGLHLEKSGIVQEFLCACEPTHPISPPGCSCWRQTRNTRCRGRCCR